MEEHVCPYGFISGVAVVPVEGTPYSLKVKRTPSDQLPIGDMCVVGQNIAELVRNPDRYRNATYGSNAFCNGCRSEISTQLVGNGPTSKG